MQVPVSWLTLKFKLKITIAVCPVVIGRKTVDLAFNKEKKMQQNQISLIRKLLILLTVYEGRRIIVHCLLLIFQKIRFYK